jgi:hypothetical protein
MAQTQYKIIYIALLFFLLSPLITTAQTNNTGVGCSGEYECTNLALQFNNVDFCFAFDKEGGPRNCIVQVAAQNQDISVCEVIKSIPPPYEQYDYTFDKDVCISAVASAANDSTFCELIETTLKDQCYGNVGFNLKNYFGDSGSSLYWTKLFSLWGLGILLTILILYSYYRQFRSRVILNSHLSWLTIIGAVAIVLLIASLIFDVTITPSLGGHPPMPITVFTGIFLLPLIVLGALMVFKRTK